jgi:hypothetical protein
MKKILSFAGCMALLLISAVCAAKGYGHVSPEHIADTLKHSFRPLMAAGPALVTMDDSRMRAALQRVTGLVAKVTGITGNGYIISPGYINSEIVITNANTTYNFEVRDLALQSGSSPRPLVRGVKDNDLAFVYQIGLFVDSRTIGNTNVYPLAYVNNTAFSGSGNTTSHVQVFYNGEFSAQVGQTVFVDNYSTRNFNYQPRTQQSSASNLSDWNIESATKSFDPYLIVSGKSDNKLQVNIKTFSGFAAAATTDNIENVLSLYMSTIIVRNGANDVNTFMTALNAGPSATS